MNAKTGEVMRELERLMGVMEVLGIDKPQRTPQRKCKHSIVGKCNKRLGPCNGYKRCKKKVYNPLPRGW